MNTPGDYENALFDEIADDVCNIAIHGGHMTRTLDHHTYRQSTQSWVRGQSKPQPYLKLKVEVNNRDYGALGFTLKARNSVAFTEAMADTGCQSCLSGTHLLCELGLTRGDLIPAALHMRAANDQQLAIIGATILRLSIPGSHKTTRQLVYVTENVKKLFLSREACEDLGLIGQAFPRIGSIKATPRDPLATKYHVLTDEGQTWTTSREPLATEYHVLTDEGQTRTTSREPLATEYHVPTDEGQTHIAVTGDTRTPEQTAESRANSHTRPIAAAEDQ